MAGRPGYNNRSQGHQDDDLLGLDDEEGPYYSSGSRPPVSDDRILHDYDTHGRISTSHDDFVGSSSQHGLHPTTSLPGGPGYAPASGLQAPPTLGEQGRQMSQTSGLNNYQRYSDLDY